MGKVCKCEDAFPVHFCGEVILFSNLGIWFHAFRFVSSHLMRIPTKNFPPIASLANVLFQPAKKHLSEGLPKVKTKATKKANQQESQLQLRKKEDLSSAHQ